jgi:predicted amidophosphoribosyltransferase
MEELWICPNCGNEMKRLTNSSGLFHVCQKCGCTIEGREQNFGDEGICPNCHGAMNSTNECSHCGYDLGSDFE